MVRFDSLKHRFKEHRILLFAGLSCHLETVSAQYPERANLLLRARLPRLNPTVKRHPDYDEFLADDV